MIVPFQSVSAGRGLCLTFFTVFLNLARLCCSSYGEAEKMSSNNDAGTDLALQAPPILTNPGPPRRHRTYPHGPFLHASPAERQSAPRETHSSPRQKAVPPHGLPLRR